VATAIAVVAALCAGCCFALGVVIQHDAARETESRSLSLGLLAELARQPRWLAGTALAGLAFAIQALALGFGPLALVQPLVAADVLFALPMIAVLHGHRLTPADWTGACAVTGGIAVFLAVSPPSTGVRTPGLAAWVPAVLVVAAAATVSVSMGLRLRGRAQVLWLAGAAGIIFGMLDALTKSTAGLLADRGMGVLLRWEPYGLMLVGVLGALLAQSAFRAGALSLSLPVIDTLEPISAVVIAATVFNEQLATSPGRFVMQLAGGCVAAGGVAWLSRSAIAAAETKPGQQVPAGAS
jgi:drug/metabolite transporter (DMT)-like permease